MRASVRAAAFLVMLAVLLPPYLALLVIAPSCRHRIAQWFFTGCLVLTGVRVRIHGEIDTHAPLHCANHASYLDIPVLGHVLTNSTFVAKSDVAAWPLFGFLARISRTEFISRASKDTRAQTTALAQCFKRGQHLIMFPEGTSTNGAVVRPFKSALFAALDDAPAQPRVQPITIVYARHANGAPLDQNDRERYTWFGTMTLAPHLWSVFGLKGCLVDVVFHAPLDANAFADRKALARRCEHTVRAALTSAITAAPDIEASPSCDLLTAVEESPR